MFAWWSTYVTIIRNLGTQHSYRPLYTIPKHGEQGTKSFFAKQNILREKGANVYYTPFVVRRQFECEHIRHWEFLFFDEKLLCVCWRDCYLNANPANSEWQKTCLQNMVNNYYILLLYVVFSSFHSFFIVVCKECITEFWYDDKIPT